MTVPEVGEHKAIGGVAVHPIGIGTWDMGGGRHSDGSVFADYRYDKREIDAIRYSIAKGQNHIDTAQIYRHPAARPGCFPFRAVSLQAPNTRCQTGWLDFDCVTGMKAAPDQRAGDNGAETADGEVGSIDIGLAIDLHVFAGAGRIRQWD